MQFKDLLETLPDVNHLAALELTQSGEMIARIENKPGQAGSLRVYHAVIQEHGGLTAEAAQKALVLYAEHTEDARNYPGKHPNIDRLIDMLASGKAFQFHFIKA